MGGSMRSAAGTATNTHVHASERLSTVPPPRRPRNEIRPRNAVQGGSRSQLNLNRVLAGRVGSRGTQQKSPQQAAKMASRIGGRVSGEGGGKKGRGGAAFVQRRWKGRSGKGRGNNERGGGSSVTRESLDAQIDAYMSKEM